jgi:3-phenylpropionate/trans-cinnamate dioxygenase ferredoxin reductase subunit
MMIAIVGSGIAGMSAALELRELGFQGRVRVFSGEATDPYDRPSLSKAFLDRGAPVWPPGMWPRETLAQRRIEVALDTRVASLNTSAHELYTEAGEVVRYERVLLATGAVPRRLDVPGAELQGVHYLRDARQARSLRADLHAGRRAVFIGGGVLGLEVAARAAASGLEATVLETEPRVMSRIVPAGFAELLTDLHEARGIRVITGARPVALEGRSSRVRAVVTGDGTSIPAELVVVSVGSEAETTVAQRSGLVVDEGIRVDDRLHTSDERVLAAGDVARIQHPLVGREIRIEQWQPAQDQGRIAAANMLGAQQRYANAPSMWSDQHEFHMRATGFGFSDLTISRYGDLGTRTGVSFLGFRDDRLEAACGIAAGTGVARTIRAAQLLIERRVPIEKDLTDPSIELPRMVRALST